MPPGGHSSPSEWRCPCSDIPGDGLASIRVLWYSKWKWLFLHIMELSSSHMTSVVARTHIPSEVGNDVTWTDQIKGEWKHHPHFTRNKSMVESSQVRCTHSSTTPQPGALISPAFPWTVSDIAFIYVPLKPRDNKGHQVNLHLSGDQQ